MDYTVSEKSVSDDFSQKESRSSRRNSAANSQLSEPGIKTYDKPDDLDDLQFVSKMAHDFKN